jgi:hypothetical protein
LSFIDHDATVRAFGAMPGEPIWYCAGPEFPAATTKIAPSSSPAFSLHRVLMNREYGSCVTGPCWVPPSDMEITSAPQSIASCIAERIHDVRPNPGNVFRAFMWA